MDARNVDPRRVDGSKNHLSQPRPAAVIILISLFSLTSFPLAGVGGGGGITGCNNPSSLEQCGTGSCTPTNGVPALSCFFTVTFNPPFATVPKYVSAQFQGCHNPECHFETQAIPQGGASFQSDNGETWTNMPAAKTEIYGNTNHEVSLTTSLNMNSAVFLVTCITGSASATAILRPEYSIDSGASWHELAQNTGGLDILVDASDCSFAASPAFSTNIAGIATAAIGISSLLLRVVGINGNGVGDVPVFNNVEILFYGSLTDLYVTCIPGVSASFICPGQFPLSTTSMTVNILRLAPATSGQATPILVNWIAAE